MNNNGGVYILSAQRTPLGSFMGSLSSVSAPRLGATAVKGAMEKSGLVPQDVQQLIMGCVLPAGQGQAPARQAAIFGGLDRSVPCVTLNKVCGSGMMSVISATQGLRCGDYDVAVAGGMENMSQVPHYWAQSRTGVRLGHTQLVDGMIHDGLWDVYNQFHMGNAAELCAREYQFTREAQDQFAMESFRRAQNAQAQGWFRPEIVAVEIPQKKGDPLSVDTDEGPGKAQFDKMAKLSPAFDKSGTITAANASTINDGAAALVLAREEVLKRKGVKPLARVAGYSFHAQAPEWFTTAPVEAMQKLLKKIGWSVGDVDLFEINEAFAVVAMAAIKQMNLDPSKVNVQGGAISLGHPIGASGARILATLVHGLQRLGLKRGVASLCIGGGEAVAMAVEVV